MFQNGIGVGPGYTEVTSIYPGLGVLSNIADNIGKVR